MNIQTGLELTAYQQVCANKELDHSHPKNPITSSAPLILINKIFRILGGFEACQLNRQRDYFPDYECGRIPRWYRFNLQKTDTLIFIYLIKFIFKKTYSRRIQDSPKLVCTHFLSVSMNVSNSTDILQHKAFLLCDEEQLVLIMWPSGIESELLFRLSLSACLTKQTHTCTTLSFNKKWINGWQWP